MIYSDCGPVVSATIYDLVRAFGGDSDQWVNELSKTLNKRYEMPNIANLNFMVANDYPHSIVVELDVWYNEVKSRMTVRVQSGRIQAIRARHFVYGRGETFECDPNELVRYGWTLVPHQGEVMRFEDAPDQVKDTVVGICRDYGGHPASLWNTIVRSDTINYRNIREVYTRSASVREDGWMTLEITLIIVHGLGVMRANLTLESDMSRAWIKTGEEFNPMDAVYARRYRLPEELNDVVQESKRGRNEQVVPKKKSLVDCLEL